MDAPAACTKLVSLKIVGQQLVPENNIFISFLAQNNFPNLEYFESNLFRGERSNLFKSTFLQQPCYGLTSFSFVGHSATLTSVDLEKFTNLKEIKLQRTENNANLFFKGFLLMF